MIKYMSPSSLSLFESDRDEFVIKYMSKKRIRYPQTEPMAAGSAFDAFVKASIMSDLMGENFGAVLGAFFIDQVEEHNRDFAIWAGGECMRWYRESGAYAYLLSELQTTVSDVQMEFGASATVGGVPLYGKPDLFFRTEYGPVIYDWKVNGYCSKSGVSPQKGYVRARGGRRQCHPLAEPRAIWNGMLVDDAGGLLQHKSWGSQLCTYAWLLGADPGSDVLVGIDQLAWRNGKCVVAHHRTLVDSEYQMKLLHRYQNAWNAIKTGYLYYDTMDRDDSDQQINSVLRSAEAMSDRQEELGYLMQGR